MEVAIVLTGELGQGRNVLASQIMSMILLKGGGNKNVLGRNTTFTRTIPLTFVLELI